MGRRAPEEGTVAWSNRVKEAMKGLLVLLALAAAFSAWVGVLAIQRRAECNRLDAARVSHLEPGHDTRGPRSIYVIGVGPGPPPSEILPYWEAEAAMQRAGCDLPGGG